MKVNSIATNSIQDSAVTSTKIADNAVTNSKIGTLNGLTVNGIVNATGFVATSGSGEEGDAFGLPRAKSLSITYQQDKALVGNDTYVSIGDETDLGAVQFAFDDNITLCLSQSAFRLKQTGVEFSSQFTSVYEVAFYNSAGVQQPYVEMTSQARPYFNLDLAGFGQAVTASAVATLVAFAGIGNGTDRIARVRLRVKHNNASASYALTDSAQITCLAVADDSGNTQRTFNAGALS